MEEKDHGYTHRKRLPIFSLCVQGSLLAWGPNHGLIVLWYKTIWLHLMGHWHSHLHSSKEEMTSAHNRFLEITLPTSITKNTVLISFTHLSGIKKKEDSLASRFWRQWQGNTRAGPSKEKNICGLNSKQAISKLSTPISRFKGQLASVSPFVLLIFPDSYKVGIQ